MATEALRVKRQNQTAEPMTGSTTPESPATPALETEIARVAYALYEQRGRVDGEDLKDWLKAEGIVKRQRTRKNLFCHA